MSVTRGLITGIVSGIESRRKKLAKERGIGHE